MRPGPWKSEKKRWSKVGDPRAPDTDLMRWALAKNYAVFSHDLARLLLIRWVVDQNPAGRPWRARRRSIRGPTPPSPNH